MRKLLFPKEINEDYEVNVINPDQQNDYNNNELNEISDKNNFITSNKNNKNNPKNLKLIPEYLNYNYNIVEQFRIKKQFHHIQYFDKLMIVKAKEVYYDDDCYRLLNILMNYDDCTCLIRIQNKIPKIFQIQVQSQGQIVKLSDLVCPGVSDQIFIIYNIYNFIGDHNLFIEKLQKIYKKLEIFDKYLLKLKNIHQENESQQYEIVEQQFIQEIQEI